jgi:hypothetical protein
MSTSAIDQSRVPPTAMTRLKAAEPAYQARPQAGPGS